jgi:cysteine desulfurase
MDYSATTPVDPAVAEVIRSSMAGVYGNASSVHRYGRSAKIVLEECRERIANSIGAEPAEIFFTGGGTESDNHALIGVALARKREKKQHHIIVSSIEHHAVLDCAEYLTTLGFSVSYLPVGRTGIIDIEALRSMITRETALVSVMHVNNEVGTIQPIPSVAEIVHQFDCVLHSDTVQSYGKVPLSVAALGIDIAALSAHKIYGPKGIGAIYIKKGTLIDPLLHGGAQERNNRAGTENVPMIAGFATAAELMESRRERLFDSTQRQKSRLLEIINGQLDNIVVNGDHRESVPHIVNISLDPSTCTLEGETLLLNLDLNGIAVSSGSACTSGSVQPSHVLLAMGNGKETTRSTVRFSFGYGTTDEEIERAGTIFCSIVKKHMKV